MARIIPAFKQYFDSNGDPLVSGYLRFLQSGTNNTKKTTYSNSAKTLPNTNPVPLDGEGRCPDVFGDGAYNVISYDSNMQQIQQFDPVRATFTATVEAYANIAALRAITAVPSITDATIRGYYTDGDGGAIPSGYYWDTTSTETDNGGTILKAAAITTGRFKGPDSNITGKQFGAKGDGSTDDRAAISAIDGVGNFTLTSGTYRISSNITISNIVTFEAGAKLSIDTGITVIFSKQPNVGDYQIFSGLGDVSVGLSPIDWWGPVANGTTDDSAVFTKAISNTGGHILLNAKTYFLNTGGFTFPTGCTILGRGRELTHIRYTGLTSTLFTINPTDELWTVSGFKITHRQLTGTPTSGRALSIETSSDNGIVKDIWITGAYDCIRNTAGQNIDFTNVDMWEFVNFGFHFLGNGINDHTISDCFINGTSTAHGIRLQNGVQALMFKNIEIVTCLYPLSTDASVNSSGNRPAYCKFTNCFFDSATNGVFLNNLVDFRFTNCWFSNRPNNGCDIQSGADGVVFDHCDFMNSDKHGCVVFNGAVRIKFLGCDFIGNGVATSNTYNGIEINAGVTDFIIKGCTFNSDANYGFGTQKYGVNVNTGASDRYIIADNLVFGNGTGGVIDNGTGVNKRVADNY